MVKRDVPTLLKITFTALKITVFFLIILILAATGTMVGAMYGFIKTTKPIESDQLKLMTSTTYIYDAKGNVITALTGKDSKNMELVMDKDIPLYLKNAFVAVEDERFYKHNGIDIKRILSAVESYVTHGRVEHGGSTITQQVVKNLTGQKEITLKRKVQEQWNAILLEKQLTKWQILELYMNVIYMGNGYYGVQSASKGYFNKEVKELSLAESAFLAGITNNPGIYNPLTVKGRDNAYKRQKIILKLMLEQGYINNSQYEEAVKQDLEFAAPGESENSVKTQSYFVDQVINDVKKDLMSEKGVSENIALSMIYNQGLKIYTTMDPDVQKVMDKVFQNDKYFPEINSKAKKYGEHPQAAMVVIDPQNGQVKGLYGGYGIKKASNTWNRAVQMKRQPGSSFKPIAVYGPAIDLGLITPATVIDDVPVYMQGTDKKLYPVNYNRKYGGLTTIRNAIKQSVNVVAAKVWNDLLGPDQSIKYLKRAGIDRPDAKYVSSSLGGLEKGVSPLEMAAAYVPFASRGMYYEPTTYTKVADSGGSILLDKNPKYSIVYKEGTAFLMTDMMRGVVQSGGTAYPRGQIKNGKNEIIPTAGKTGTTSDNIDKWFVGYSPYYVAATWYGYDNKNKRIEIMSNEYNQAQEIWHAVMTGIHNGKERIELSKPAGIVTRVIDIYSGKLATELSKRDPRGNSTREEYFIKGTEPGWNELDDIHVQAVVCIEHKDIWGRRFVAGEYCPPDSVSEGVFIQRKIPYMPIQPDDPYPKDWQYELPAGEYCNIHAAVS